MKKIAIIDYGAGNVQSVRYALNRLGYEPVVTHRPSEIRPADKVIFPGVGEAASAMQALRGFGLDKLIVQLKQPVLGICLGLQLMCEFSEERQTPCLGIFKQKVMRFEPKLKVPHVGWNSIFSLKNPLFKGIAENQYVYFVHSYYLPVFENSSAQSNYIVPFSAAAQKDNFFACQFHPEKSGETGEKILKNFLDL